MRFRIAVSVEVELAEPVDSRLPYDLASLAAVGAIDALRECGPEPISSRTRVEHHALPPARVCAACAGVIDPRSPGVAGRGRRYCSNACRSAAYRRRRAARGADGVRTAVAPGPRRQP